MNSIKSSFNSMGYCIHVYIKKDLRRVQSKSTKPVNPTTLMQFVIVILRKNIVNILVLTRHIDHITIYSEGDGKWVFCYFRVVFHFKQKYASKIWKKDLNKIRYVNGNGQEDRLGQTFQPLNSHSSIFLTHSEKVLRPIGMVVHKHLYSQENMFLRRTRILQPSRGITSVSRVLISILNL